jgi:hypothetical protein
MKELALNAELYEGCSNILLAKLEFREKVRGVNAASVGGADVVGSGVGDKRSIFSRTAR